MAGQYRFKDQSGNIVAQISGSVGGAIAFSGSVVDFTQANNIILGNVQLAGTASNALLLDGFDSQAFAFTSSIHPFTASIAGTNTFTSSATARLNSIETISASNVSRLNAVETITASNIARLNSIETITSSNLARLNALEIKTGSLATTGSNTFIGTQTITGSLYISSDLIVQGSSSLQNITASAVSIGTNIINLNTANPAIRYAGLSIGDSGSIGSSGSFLYDSVQDEMIFIHRGANTTVTSSVVLMGPQTFDNIGGETYPTSNIIQKGTGNEHLIDSCIFDNGTTVCVNANLIGSGNITTNGGIVGNNSNNLYLSSNSTTGEISFWGNQLSTRLMTISGSGNVGIGTNSPINKLTISNDGNSVVAFRINDTNANASFLSLNASNTDSAIIAGGTSAIPFDIYTGGSPRMRITSLGCVGIGTTAPQTTLHVLNCTDGVVGGSYFGQLIVERNAEAAINIKGLSYSSIYFGDAANAIESAIVYNHSTNNLELRGSGNVADLTIASTGIASFTCQVCAPTLEITSTNTNVYPRVNRSNTSYEAGWKLATGGTDSWYTGLRSADGVGSYHFYSYTTNTSVVAITCTGNVGINTTNFGERLNIGCGGAIGFQNTSNCQKWHIVYNTNDGLNFVESAVADFRLFLKAGGNIGIGTNTPEYPLHIYRCSPLGIKVQTCGSNFGSPGINLLNGGVDTVLSATNNGLEIGTWSANDIIFKVTQVERMRINTSGIVTMPFQPSMLVQPGASMFPIGTSPTAYGWCTSGGIRYNCGFTLTSATTAACNIADAQNTGKIIIPATGRYLLQFSQRNEGQYTQDGQFFLWVNGIQRIRRHIEMWNGKPYIHVDVTAALALNSGDCLEMGAFFNGAGKTDTFSGTGDQVNWMSLAKIS